MPIHQVDKLTELLIFSFPESSQDCTLTAQKKIPLPVSGKVVIQLNAKGGIVLLSVEDDGKVTGSHPNHRHHTFNNLEIAHTQVPKSRQVIATSEGILPRRCLIFHE